MLFWLFSVDSFLRITDDSVAWLPCVRICVCDYACVCVSDYVCVCVCVCVVGSGERNIARVNYQAPLHLDI